MKNVIKPKSYYTTSSDTKFSLWRSLGFGYYFLLGHHFLLWRLNIYDPIGNVCLIDQTRNVIVERDLEPKGGVYKD